MLGCKLANLPTTYLGFPLSIGPMKAFDWNFVLQKVDKKLASLKGKLLSLGGRLSLINSVLSALPSYWMSSYLLSTMMIISIDRRKRNFLWRGDKQCNGGHCLVSWENVYKPKKLGGLGVLNLRLFNKCLLLKRWNVNTKTWKMLIQNEYYGDRNALACQYRDL